jgi:hypothetical protein
MPSTGTPRSNSAGSVVGVERAGRAAGENDRLRLELFDLRERDRARMDLAVDVLLANATGDELRVLSTEIENQNEAVLHGQ